MSDTKWTKEQLEAITERNCNLLVAAAAGAGKTAVLVERIIRRITDEKDPVDIDRLLVVTFTNAAATEMRERIGEAVAKALEKNPHSDILKRQMTLINKASITTMHSFCLEVIRNNFHCIDLDPGFRIANETEALLMKMEALEEMFEERYEEENLSQEFLELVECYGGNRGDGRLQDMVLGLYEFVQSHPWPEKWLKEHVEAFNVPEGADLSSTSWARMLMGNVKIEVGGMLQGMEKAINVIESTPGLERYLDCFQEDVSGIRRILESCEGSWDELYNAFSTLEFGRLPRCGKDVDKDKQGQVKSIRDDIKSQIRKIRDEIFNGDSGKIIAYLRSLYPLVKCLADLVIELGQRYGAKKKEKSLLDFNDLEHLCLEILLEEGDGGRVTPSKVAVEYRERFQEILVDEYQDSNLVQEVILSAISRKDTSAPNVFMVGDVKQSIYRFRQARPELFMEKYNTYSTVKGSKDRKIQLYKNFRSRKGVIDGVNFVFKQIMSRNLGELDYDDNEALNPGAVYAEPEDGNVLAGGPVEVHIIDMDGDSTENTEREALPQDDEAEGFEASDEEEDIDVIQAEARVVVKKIRELMEPDDNGRVFKVYDRKKGGYREVQFKDIVILLRTTKNWADVFLEELSAQGIPAYADTGTGYFQTVEVQTVMSLLQIIDNPLQDIPLLAVLKSPIVSFSPEELIDIRLVDRQATFYEAMVKMAKEGRGDTSEKVGSFLNTLAKWRDKALHTPTDELIWYLYGETGYYSYVGAMPGGAQRQANLRILFERARQYEETSYKGLFNFINFINKLRSSQGDMGSAKILGENENVVRIMSIHKSKGLEFPVVFVSGCGKRFNLMDINRNILFHHDMGFGPDFVDYERRISYPTLPKHALKYKIKLETLSEEMRILYVAFTRAREKLIVTGCVKDLGKAAARWCASMDAEGLKLPDYEMLKGNCYLDWIGPAIARHSDGKVLRRAAGSMDHQDITDMLKDQSVWEVRTWSKSDVLMGKADADQNGDASLEWIENMDMATEESPYWGIISKRLGWEYPYKLAERLPTKISVTELKRLTAGEMADEYPAATIYMPPLVKKPAFLEGARELSAAERGSVLHFVLQHLDLNRVSMVDEIRNQIHEMVDSELITEQQAKVVDILRIDRFFCSPLGGRLLSAERVNREIPFTIQIKSTEIYKHLPEETYGDETMVLQGVIDCYFEEQDGIVLLDYKTDYVSPHGGLGMIKERYKTQMDYYTMALERITGKRVGEKYIYLFWNGQVIAY